MVSQHQTQKVTEAEQSLRDMEAEANKKAEVRDQSGRYIPRYPGISRPDFPMGWDRKEARARLRECLPLNEWVSVSAAAKRCTLSDAALVSDLSRLSWYGWAWRSGTDTFAIETCITKADEVRLDHCLSTPDGALVIGFIRITTESTK